MGDSSQVGQEPPPKGAPEADAEEPREWLLDGFNVVHAALLGDRPREEWWTERHRSRLLERLQHFRRPGTVWVVFDGPRPAEPVDGESAERARVVFTPSADDWIVRRVRASAEPDRLAVVTRDRKVADRSRHRGARIVAPAAFLADCPEPAPVGEEER